MNIEVKGHSGCTIEVRNAGIELHLVKQTTDVQYVNRLFVQAQKQQKYSSYSSNMIKIPRILNLEKDEAHCCIEMEYVYSKNFVDFFETSEPSQIHNFSNSICSFIDLLITESVFKEIPLDVLRNKWDEVYRNIVGNQYINGDQEINNILSGASVLFNNVSHLNLPIGRCHGDLTFSNVLFNGNEYYLIDFLDSFIESPLIDIVKLRQDTAYQWSLLMYTGNYNRPRMKLISDRIDMIIKEHYQKYDWYRESYSILQLMNFLRILQYAHDKEVIAYLKKTLKHILIYEF